MSKRDGVSASGGKAIGLCLAVAMGLVLVLSSGAALGVDDSDYWFCNSIEDFLDSRPYYGNAKGEGALLQWGREQGIPALQGEVLPGQRRQALDSVYKLIMKKLLPDVVLAKDAPDAGVKVVVGEPNIVMFAPEGKVSDREGNRVRLGHLAPTIPKEGRWGQFMFPGIKQLRDGLLVVTVCVGGDSPVGRSYLYFVSDDGGRNWTHHACYDCATERPASETALFKPETSRSMFSVSKVDGEEKNHQISRSFDGGRTWLHTGTIPQLHWWPFRPEWGTVRAHVLEFPNGDWVAAYRHNGLYSSGGGPLILTKSTDQGKTWSKPKAIRMPGVNPAGLVLENGIGVYLYQRPGLFLTFCGDGKGDLWGNDVTLVRAWRSERAENSCSNSTLLATGPDRFLLAYTKYDVPDPWGQPRHAVIVQEFVVSRK